MAERLATVPEESTNASPAAYPQCSIYRDWIRTVAVSRGQIRSTLFSSSQSGHSGSSYSGDSGDSGASNSYGCSSGSAAANATDSVADRLTLIARQMVNDGYTIGMVEAFSVASPKAAFQYGGGPDRVSLENWFSELDVRWVLQIREGYGLQQVVQLQDQDKSASSLQELVDKWIRALIVIAVSITELFFVGNDASEVARFGKASIAKMLVFTEAVVPALKAENLPAVLDMYICVSNASYTLTPSEMSPEAQSILTEIGSSLAGEGNRLSVAISSAMEELRTLVEDDDSWAIEIPGGGGEVHRITRFMMDCIASMRKTRASTEKSAPSHHTGNLRDLIDGTTEFLRDLLFRKSMLCSDPSLRYLLLLNNSNFMANAFDPSLSPPFLDLELWSLRQRLKRDCGKYMDSYIDASWGHVISCIPTSVFSRPLIHRWSKTSLLANFESAFHKTCQTQKFWKVPEPRLRNSLRKDIARRVISVYRDCLEENPELQKHVNAGKGSSPDVLEEMLGELFEG